MGRRLLIRTNEYPYHVTARANNKESFYLEKHLCWDIFCHFLLDTQSKYNIEIHAFVMMSNHIHLMVSTPKENIDQAMRHFMTMTSKAIAARSARMNRVWGARYYRSLITTPDYYAHAFRYLYANPLEAGVVNKVKDYPWSLLFPENFGKYQQSLIVKHRSGFDIYIPESPYQLQAWINHKHDFFYNEQVGKALRKSVFKFSNTKEVKKYDYFKRYLLKK
jgi:REP element-mobilizing transposase RayT